ncbi:MAG: 4-(cytidine 5'-diphospho)-2-C-methyl-D-erythritol kinase [Nitrospirae bacterium GWC2_46_6]|nr:MAG: 4-(cytidine 5'-diphospho)-2-C-methyl-D-erythritol kinase [Nitrospirae bacterium GWC2_46_6]OGW23179.1 MAG: 4-(cytidine 5'-diphospho)-2-C-methyl-D-erythritol kinase [Nitrospirae bacterium GWB2_47_37]
MHCIGLYDTLTFEPSDNIEFSSDMDIPHNQNLVYKAAVKLQSYAAIKTGAGITLKKEIPSGAGLGGGSSDAAYTLMGLNKLWGLGLDAGELKHIGSGLGADVPFFFDCPIAIAEGKGEILTPLNISVPYTLLVVKPSISVSTAWAYEQIGARGRRQGIETTETGNDEQSASELTKTGNKINNIKLIYDALKGGDTSFLRAKVHNDFEDVVRQKYPVIGSVKEELLNAGALLSIMSGSGSAVFGLFEDRDTAISVSSRFPSHWNRVIETLV